MSARDYVPVWNKKETYNIACYRSRESDAQS